MSSKRLWFTLIIGCVFAGLLLSAISSSVQSLAQDEAEEIAEAVESSNKLHIMSTAAIARQLEKVEIAIEQKRWKDVIKSYLGLLKRHRDEIFEVESGLHARYRSVEEYIKEQMRALPSGAKAAYRFEFDRGARQLFIQAARRLDVPVLQRVAEEFFLSSYADDALNLLGSYRLEQGDFEQAAALFIQILSGYRDTDLDRGIITVKAAVALSRVGGTEEISELIASVRQQPGTGLVKTGNRNEKLISVLERLRSVSAVVALGRGSGSKSVIPVKFPAISRRITSVQILSASARGEVVERFGDGRRIIRRASSPTDVQRRHSYSFFPVVADGKIYCATGYSVLCLASEEGKLLARFRPGGAKLQRSYPANTVLMPVVSRGMVYANVITEFWEEERALGITVKAGMPKRSLIAFDKDSGRVMWKANDSKEFQKQFRFSRWSFLAPPLIVGDALYVEMKERSGTIRSWLLCYDAQTGELRWARCICSNGLELTMFGETAREPFSTPGVAATVKGRRLIYWCTNLGVVTAVCAETGAIVWCSTYAQIPLEAARGYYAMLRDMHWAAASPVISDGVIVVTPLDSRYCYGFNAADGRFLWRFGHNVLDSNLTYLVGVKDEKVFLSGRYLTAVGLHSGKLLSYGAAVDIVSSGRGVVAADGVYIPNEDQICKFGFDTRLLKRLQLPARSPLARADAGNITIVTADESDSSQERVIITTDSKLILYGRE